MNKELDHMVMKLCIECNIEKPETNEFFEVRKDTGKFRNKCKACRNNRNKNRSANKAQIEAEKQKRIDRQNQVKSGYRLCLTCDTEKPETEEFFSFRNDNDKFRNECKECKNAYNQQYYIDNKEKLTEYSKQYNDSHKEELKIWRKQYYAKTSVRQKEHSKQYREEHPEKTKAYQAEYRRTHKAKAREYGREYNRKLRTSHPKYRIRDNVSSEISRGLKGIGYSKGGKSCWNYLDYSLAILMVHLENQFEPWMTWDNYGRYNPKTWDDNDPSTWTWQIDHIIPHSLFNYTSMEDAEFKACWALSNLRPLCSKQNLMDGVRKTRHKLKRA